MSGLRRLKTNQLFILGAIISLSMIILASVAHFWIYSDVGSMEPTVQLAFIGFGIFMCFLGADYILRRRW